MDTASFEDEFSSDFSCTKCGAPVNPARWEIGYNICKRPECAHKPPTRTLATLHKSNTILITDLEDLKGINNKGGLYR
jgi:hypothetical protein